MAVYNPLIFMLKISLLVLLTQSPKYLAGFTDFIPGEGGGRRVPYKNDGVIIGNLYRNLKRHMKFGLLR